MKRFFALCAALAMVMAIQGGCEKKVKTERTDTVSSPGGTTTTTDEHTVTSSGHNPPPNDQGERAK